MIIKRGDIVQTAHGKREFVGLNIIGNFICWDADGMILHAFEDVTELLEPVFTNSLGEEFFEGDTAYYFHKSNGSILVVQTSKDRYCLEASYNTSEVYKDGGIAKLMFNRFKVEQAYAEGTAVEYNNKSSKTKWIHTCFPSWDWHVCDYRIKEQPKYRPYELEEADEFLGLKVKLKNEKVFSTIDYIGLKEQLTGFFDSWETLDGKPVGKLIE